MKSRIVTTTFFLILFGMSLQAQQPKLSFELNTGASYATRSLGGADLNIGGGFEGILHYRIMPHVDLLAGWGWNKFSADASFIGDDVDFEETGYIFGAQFIHPFPMSDLEFYLRANGLYNHLEVENKDGDIIEDTGHGLGLQLAGGIAVPINEHWTFTPGLKFNALNRDLKTDQSEVDLKQRYLSLRVGITYNF